MAESGFDIGPAEPDEQHAALSLVLSDLDPAARGPLIDSLADQPRESLGPLDALVVARNGDGVVAACWAQPQRGCAATLWLPRDLESDAPEAAIPLVRSTLAIADAAGVTLCQALLEGDDDPRSQILDAAGVAWIAELRYLSRMLSAASPERVSVEKRITYRGVTESDLGEFGVLTRLTYAGSLDCPELGDRRPIEHTLSGYREIGRSDLDGWRFVHIDGEPAGVLVVALHADGDQAELVYLGLVPNQRGKGLGKLLIDEALRIGGVLGAERMITAVDTRNEPARAAYERRGFAAWASRHAFVRFHPDLRARSTSTGDC